MDANVRRPIRAFAHFDYEAGCLRIDLANDHAITLTCRNDEPPKTTLWIGGGEISLDAYSRARFYEWLERLLYELKDFTARCRKAVEADLVRMEGVMGSEDECAEQFEDWLERERVKREKYQQAMAEKRSDKVRAR